MKKRICIPLILTLIVSFTGCSHVTDVQKKIYDNDELIVQEGDTYTFGNRVVETNDSNIEIQYGKFYGTQTIWTINVEQDSEIEFEIDSEVQRGRFKGVLISEDNQITTVFEGSYKDNHSIMVSKGKYRFKIVGNNAEGKIKIELKSNGNIKVEA